MTESLRTRRGYADVEGAQLHYREAGDPASPTLLLLHQSPSHSAMYEPLMAELADRFHLLAPDNPGFGGSDPLADGMSIEGMARAIRGFLRARGIERCLVFGHHAGAAVAVQLEYDYPGTTIALALSGPPLLDDAMKQALPGLASPFPLQDDGSHLLAMWRRMRGKDPLAALDLSQREAISALQCGDAYQQSYTAVTQQDFAGQLPALDCAVLVFAGDEDALHASVEPTLARLRDGRRAGMPAGAGTYACEREVGRVAANLRAFFEDILE